MPKERAPETSLAPGQELEPLQLHGVSDTSLHVCLPTERGQELTGLGWAQPHAYGDFGTEFMVYGPRTDTELGIILAIIEESLAYARGPAL